MEESKDLIGEALETGRLWHPPRKCPDFVWAEYDRSLAAASTATHKAVQDAYRKLNDLNWKVPERASPKGQGATVGEGEGLSLGERDRADLLGVLGAIDNAKDHLAGFGRDARMPVSDEVASSDPRERSAYDDGAVASVDDTRPSVFLSYAHLDSEVARALAGGLEAEGLCVWVDDNELLPGDSIIEQISTAVAGVDFFCALVSEASRESNWCRKELSLAMTHGLGREGATVIPVRVGEVGMPDSLVDLLYVQLDPGDVSGAVRQIARAVAGHRARRQQYGDTAVTQETPETAEPSAPTADPGRRSEQLPVRPETLDNAVATDFEPIQIVGVVKEGVGQPRNDETRGSALYRVPLRLSRRPTADWAEAFKQTWDHPPRFTMMHRPGIAHVEADTIVLNGTTMQELEQVHVTTLKLVVERVNEEIARIETKERLQRDREEATRRSHRQDVDDIADRLTFE